MLQNNGVLVSLILLVVIFLVVFAIMFVGYRRSKLPRHENKSAVGMGTRADTSAQQLQYRGTEGAMNEDVGSNLRRVSETARDTTNMRGARDGA